MSLLNDEHKKKRKRQIIIIMWCPFDRGCIHTILSDYFGHPTWPDVLVSMVRHTSPNATYVILKQLGWKESREGGGDNTTVKIKQQTPIM